MYCMEVIEVQNLTKLLRYLVLDSTTKAGSGHPTSALSAVELMAALMWSENFKYDVENPNNTNNDRLIFSKGHASPLFYSLWAVAGGIPFQEMDTLRKFGSRLEGHPANKFPFTVAPTGSLGQGLSIGAGMAYSYKHLDNLNNNVFVLLGDGEAAEGSVWETAMFAAHYKLNNLIAILDVNRLEQVGETMLGWDLQSYKDKFQAFGWEVVVVENGNDYDQVSSGYNQLFSINSEKPRILIAKTLKGAGISFLENSEEMHGKALNQQKFVEAIGELGEVQKIVYPLTLPESSSSEGQAQAMQVNKLDLAVEDLISTRRVYGKVLSNIYQAGHNIVVLDGGVSNSTFAEDFKNAHPDRYIEGFIQEQNMVGVALGLERTGKIPFISTFAVFLTRAFDQLRMAALGEANIKIVGTHAGVAIGEDGPSQMGLEDIALGRSLWNSTVYYPSDAYEAEHALIEAVNNPGITYVRLGRSDTPKLHDSEDRIMDATVYGHESNIKIISAGETLVEAIKASQSLHKEGISVEVIGLLKLKPLTGVDFMGLADDSIVLTVEDHYEAGGLGEAVKSELSNRGIKIYSLFVNNLPESGTKEDLYMYEGLNEATIVKKIKDIIN